MKKQFLLFMLGILLVGSVLSFGNVFAGCEITNCAVKHVSMGALDSNWIPLAADIDGDGKSDPLAYNSNSLGGEWGGEWIALLSNSNYGLVRMNFGGPGHIPYTGDIDGDGKTDIAVYNPSIGGLHYRLAKNFAEELPPIDIGTGWDLVLADYDNDGKVDAVGYIESTSEWYYSLSSEGFSNVYKQNSGWLGGSGFKPIQVDMYKQRNGDLVVFNPSTGMFQARLRSNYSERIDFGHSSVAGFKPVIGDYDSDGKTDVGIYRDWGLGIELYYAFSSKAYAVEGPIYIDLGSPGWKIVSGNWDDTPKSDPVGFKEGQWFGEICDYICTDDPDEPYSLNQAYWADLNGQKISSAQVGDSVMMVFGGENLGGTQLTYEIQEFNSGVWYNPLTWFNKGWDSQPKITSTKGYQIYKIDNIKTKRFNVSVDSTGVWKLSNNLTIGSGNNAQPVATITSPDSGFKGSVGNLIPFKQRSTDSDDLLKITWDFGDSSTDKVFQNYSKFLNANSADVSHSYSKEGNYVITLIANEMTRGQSDRDSVQVQIFKQGINIIPIISSPVMDSIQGYVVSYDASQSYVANCYSMEGSSSVSNPNFVAGNLGCDYILAPGEKFPSQGVVQIRWKEIDSNGDIVEWIRGSDAEGVVWDSSNYDDAVVFPKLYKSPKFRRIRMEMSYSSP